MPPHLNSAPSEHRQPSDRGQPAIRAFALFGKVAQVALIALLAGGSLSSRAADFGDRTPSVNELINALNVQPGNAAIGARPDGVRTRGLKIVNSNDSAPAAAAPDGKAAPATAGRVSLRIQFEVNSDRVLGASANSLTNLATALNSEALKSQKFAVVGHTDVTGSQNYNLKLSERRAQSVADFLSLAGVDQGRASTEGRGPLELLDNLPANAPQQRRVEILMLD